MKTFLALFTLLFSSSVFAKCISGDCTNSYGTYTFPDGAKYVGEWKDGRENGQGTITDYYANGDKYVGKWKDGERHAQGTYTYADGRVVNPIWKNGKKEKYNYAYCYHILKGPRYFKRFDFCVGDEIEITQCEYQAKSISKSLATNCNMNESKQIAESKKKEVVDNNKIVAASSGTGSLFL